MPLVVVVAVAVVVEVLVVVLVVVVDVVVLVLVVVICNIETLFCNFIKIPCTEKISVSMVMRGWVGESISSVANSLWRLICSYFFSFVALHTLCV